jgi:hypothetical protein
MYGAIWRPFVVVVVAAVVVVVLLPFLLSFCFRIVELYFETYAGTNIRRRQLHL